MRCVGSKYSYLHLNSSCSAYRQDDVKRLVSQMNTYKTTVFVLVLILISVKTPIAYQKFTYLAHMPFAF